MRSETKSRQAEYIGRLDELYSSVEKWIENTGLTVSRSSIELNEEISGPYEAPAAAILDAEGKKVAELLPLGAWIIGAEGRVDLVGPLDRTSLVYLRRGGPHIDRKEADATGHPEGRSRPLFQGIGRAGWYWIEDKRLGRAHPVTKRLFLDLLAGVSDHGL